MAKGKLPKRKQHIREEIPYKNNHYCKELGHIKIGAVFPLVKKVNDKSI